MFAQPGLLQHNFASACHLLPPPGADYHPLVHRTDRHSPEKTSLAFQSRLGADAWLQPYTVAELRRLAEAGVNKLLVICPAFVADCLETLEEIGLRGKEEFLGAGGGEFELVPCLNDHPAWIDTLQAWIQGWQSAPA